MSPESRRTRLRARSWSHGQAQLLRLCPFDRRALRREFQLSAYDFHHRGHREDEVKGKASEIFALTSHGFFAFPFVPFPFARCLPLCPLWLISDGRGSTR